MPNLNQFGIYGEKVFGGFSANIFEYFYSLVESGTKDFLLLTT